MNLKRGVGIDYCYKVRKQGGEHALAIIAIKIKETIKEENMHLPALAIC